MCSNLKSMNPYIHVQILHLLVLYVPVIYDLDLVGVVPGEDYNESDDDEDKQPKVPVHSWPHAPTQLSRTTENENC